MLYVIYILKKAEEVDINESFQENSIFLQIISMLVNNEINSTNKYFPLSLQFSVQRLVFNIIHEVSLPCFNLLKLKRFQLL